MSLNPGTMMFLRPGGTVKDLHDGSALLVTFRMMTRSVMVIAMTNRLIEDLIDVSHGYVVLTSEGLFVVAEGCLMTPEEMMDTVYVRYGPKAT